MNKKLPEEEKTNRMYELFEKFDMRTLSEISEILYEQASPHGEINTPAGRWVFINPINKQWFSKEELALAKEQGRIEGHETGYQSGRDFERSALIKRVREGARKMKMESLPIHPMPSLEDYLIKSAHNQAMDEVLSLLDRIEKEEEK